MLIYTYYLIYVSISHMTSFMSYSFSVRWVQVLES